MESWGHHVDNSDWHVLKNCEIITTKFVVKKTTSVLSLFVKDYITIKVIMFLWKNKK